MSAGIFERDSVAKGISSPGFRAMAVSSDGKHLAAGDCQGNIHIFNLYTSEYIFIQVNSQLKFDGIHLQINKGSYQNIFYLYCFSFLKDSYSF